MVRRHRVLVILVTVLATGAAVGFSVLQKPSYTANAAVQFRDVSQDLALAGGSPSGVVQTADQLAAQGAQTVLSTQVLQHVRALLDTPRSVDELRSDLTTTADTKSNLVTIQAQTADAKTASSLANEAARQAVAIQTKTDRRGYARGAEKVQAQFQALSRRDRRDPAISSGFYQRIASLKTLSLNAMPVTLVEAATVPDSPSSPKPVLNTILGLFIGLLLAFVLAFVRDALDHRMRDLDDIQDQLQLPMLGAVRREALGLAAYVHNGRAPMSEQDVESFRILRTNLRFLSAEQAPSVIVVTSAVAEEGKSTVAASLALATAASGEKTMLVECDLRRPSLAARLGLAAGPGLSDYLAGTAGPQEVMQWVDATEMPISPNGNGAGPGAEGSSTSGQRLACLTAGDHRMLPAEMLASARFSTFLSNVAEVFDVVIIDTPPLLSVADTIEILPRADGILLCVRADRTTRDQAVAAKAALDRLPARPTGLVVTGLTHENEGYYGYYSSHTYSPRRAESVSA